MVSEENAIPAKNVLKYIGLENSQACEGDEDGQRCQASITGKS